MPSASRPDAARPRTREVAVGNGKKGTGVRYEFWETGDVGESEV